jgi:hypothetical protein
MGKNKGGNYISELCLPLPGIKKNTLLMFRLMVSLILLFLILYSINCFGLINFPVYFTNWTLVTTLLAFSLLTLLQVSLDSLKNKKKGNMFCHIALILYEISFTLQPITAIGFWCFIILPGYLKFADMSSCVANSNTAIHIFPVLAHLAHIPFCRIRFKKNHLGNPILYGFIYLFYSLTIVPFIPHHRSGEDVYQFLKYTDVMTYLIILSFLAILLTMFYFGYWIGEKKHKKFKKIKK